MASDDSSGPRSAAPIVIRIKLRYDDVDVMVQRFATNVGKSGLFLPTKSLQPIGAEIKFELRLADDTAVLVGLGRVKAATPPDPNNPKATFGMAIELMRVTPQSRALILRMLERRRAVGLPELGLPLSADIDAARRAEAVNASVRDPVSGLLPVPTVPIAPIEAPAGEALLTAPRRQTGPMGVAKVLAVTPLAPEPPRRKRPAISEIIEGASGPVAGGSVATPGLDDHVDLAAAIVRARSLAGGALDAELGALSERAAAPVEISIEAASAELAKQLGGSAVRRDRSARWATPPMTTLPAPAAPSPSTGIESGPEAAHAPLDLEPIIVEPSHPGSRPSPSDAAGERALDPALAGAPAAEHREVEPDQMTGEIHPPDELDLEDAEHTELGDAPVGLGAEPPAVDDDDLGLARPLGMPVYSDPAAGYDNRADLDTGPREDETVESPLDLDLDLDLEEVDELEILAEADVDDADLLAAHGEQEASNRHAIRDRQAPERRSSGVPSDSMDPELPPLPRTDSGAPTRPLPHQVANNQVRRGQAMSDQPGRNQPGQSHPAVSLGEPAILRGEPEPPSPYGSPVDDHELESALEALDVDLDDLSVPRAATHPTLEDDDG